MISERTLPTFLRSVLTRDLPDGWLYLPQRDVTETTVCVFIPSDDVEGDQDDASAVKAALLGFPVEGLDNQTMQDVAFSAILLDPHASDAFLVQAFLYYHRFDAFLPSIDAHDAPEPEQALLELDHASYDGLGAESSEMLCRREGCGRGSVYLSAFCRKHHFENVWKRPCPFE